MKDHEIAQLVNELESVCNMFYGTQQLREHIARVVKRAVLQGNNTNGDLLRKLINDIDTINTMVGITTEQIRIIESNLMRIQVRLDTLENPNASVG